MNKGVRKGEKPLFDVLFYLIEMWISIIYAKRGYEMKYTKEDILRIVEEEDVEFLRLQFSDIDGSLKNLAVTKSQIEKALDGKFMFDGSSIEGFARAEEADMFLRPDFDTFTIFPWRPQNGKVARLLCDVCTSDGKQYEGDVRYALKRVIKKAADMGYNFDISPELEFFLFHLDEEGLPTTISHEQAGYFDVAPLDLGENARRDIVLTLEEMGYSVLSSHHEIAPSQHEVDFDYYEPLKAADNIQTFKLAVKTVAKRHGLHASFMPKPREGVPGSGMHINISMYNDMGKDQFRDDSDPNGISKEAYAFIGGIMKHMKAITAVVNPIVNSYKRLVPGFDAPTSIAWSTKSRYPFIRVRNAGEDAIRIELRSPDSSANPYLMLATILACGLKGIEENISCPERVDDNLYSYTESELKAKGIKSLPPCLGDAVNILVEDEFIKGVLGEYISTRYIDTKKKEFMAYRSAVSEWELERYLNRI